MDMNREDVSKGWDNPESKAAYEKVRSTRQQSHEIILNLLELVLKADWHGGLTCKEISGKLGKPMHAISGRITELEELGLVVRGPEKRDGGKAIHLAAAPFPIESAGERPSNM
jgi:hypothetical protein